MKTYEITLTTKGPVFIGSGKEFGKKEYVFLSENEIGIVDISKLYTTIQKKGLERKFEEYILQDNKRSLDQWLNINRVLSKEIESSMKYRIRYGKLSLERGKKLEIREFVKDPYGKPYIPGSSLKGMLRTILLAEDIIVNPQMYRYDTENLARDLSSYSAYRKFPAQSIRKTEAKRFNLLDRKENKNDAVNDIMSGMIISDSDPLEMTDLVLCQRVERKVDGTEKKLNVLRECIKPGCRIRFSLTIDESVCGIKVQDIISAVQKFANMYNKCFICKFKGMNLLNNDMVCLGAELVFCLKQLYIQCLVKKMEFE